MKLKFWKVGETLKDDIVIAAEYEKGIIDYVCRELENETKEIE